MKSKAKSIGFRDGSMVDEIYSILKQKAVKHLIPKDIRDSRSAQIAWIVDQWCKDIEEKENQIKNIEELKEENKNLKAKIEQLNSKLKKLEEHKKEEQIKAIKTTKKNLSKPKKPKSSYASRLYTLMDDDAL